MPASAGPPFETDDTAPTDTGHWEIYVFTDAGGRGAEFDGAAGLDINHGLLPGVQVTATLPLQVSSGDSADVAVGDIDLGLKYRFLTARGGNGWSAALAPIVTLPLIAGDQGVRTPGFRLPLWGQWDHGGWSIYGGGGLAFSGEANGSDFWFGGLVVTHAVGEQGRLGMEVTRHGPERPGAHAETGLALGCLVPVMQPLLFHAAAGPRFVDGEETGYRFYVALAAVF